MRIGRRIVQFFGDVREGSVTDDLGNQFRVPSFFEPIALEILTLGNYEPQTSRMIRQHLRTGSTFVDIGANVGVFAVRASKYVGEKGHVYAVEASPIIYRYLVDNVNQNQQSAVVTTIHSAATSQDADEITFYESSSDKFGMGSLGSWPQGGTVKSTVRGRTLDTLHESWNSPDVSLVKVDVEGFEQHVFEGGRNVFTGSSPPQIVFEFVDWAETNAGFSPGDAQRTLLEYGYQLWRLDSWLKQEEPMSQVIDTGAEMIVASHVAPDSFGGVE